METRTLVDIFFASVAHDVQRHVMFKRGSDWQIISSRQLYGYVAKLARSLEAMGHSKRRPRGHPERKSAGMDDCGLRLRDQRHHRRAYLCHAHRGTNSLSFAEFARAGRFCFHAGAVAQGAVYPGPRLQLEKIVVMDDVAEVNVIPMWSLINCASTEADPILTKRAHQIKPEDLATLIYTSGTTGTSKGVMLSHGNLTACAIMASKQAEWEPGDVYLSFLPLSHVTARHVDYVCYLDGVSLAYCAVFDQLPQMLQEAKPTIIVAVPRVYEKIRAEAERRAGHGLQRKIFDWAVRVGEKHKEEIARGETPTSRCGSWPTNWCFPKYARDLAAAAGPIFPAARRWEKTWQSGSARWAFPLWKATASRKLLQRFPSIAAAHSRLDRSAR